MDKWFYGFLFLVLVYILGALIMSLNNERGTRHKFIQNCTDNRRLAFVIENPDGTSSLKCMQANT